MVDEADRITNQANTDGKPNEELLAQSQFSNKSDSQVHDKMNHTQPIHNKGNINSIIKGSDTMRDK